MTTRSWYIPDSTLHWLDRVPKDRPVAMLIRHSVRDDLPPGEMGVEMPLTEDGRRLALELGGHMRGRLFTINASPTRRTVETAACFGDGSGLSRRPEEDRLLGEPGVYVLDQRAGHSWRQLGHDEVMRRLVEESEPPPGCAAPDAAARFLVRHMLSEAAGRNGLHAFVTHDSLVTTTAARMLGARLTNRDWPKYLEAAFFWEADGEVHAAYRERSASRRLPLTHLADEDVVGLARREIAATVGLDCKARYFLAGGAFKSLLTGRSPRDLDVWAASSDDRRAIVDALLARGAERLPPAAYNQPFRIGARIVELAVKVDAASLEERLQRFDLALSAVGAEHTPTQGWRASIHPLARASVERRQVLLLPDLRNWRYCLVSIERLRRYARELNFDVPQAEEARLWSIFDQHTPEVRAEMMERFQACTRGDQDVGIDVERRSMLRPS